MISEAKAKDTTFEAKAKDMTSCPWGSSSPRPWPQRLILWSKHVYIEPMSRENTGFCVLLWLFRCWLLLHASVWAARSWNVGTDKQRDSSANFVSVVACAAVSVRLLPVVSPNIKPNCWTSRLPCCWCSHMERFTFGRYLLTGCLHLRVF